MTRAAKLALAWTLVSATANAHIALDSPPVRDATMKTAPCGGATLPGANPGAVTTFRPGQTVTLRWHETIAHPGFFRIAFSPDGRTFPSDPTDPPAAAEFPVLAIIPKTPGVTSYSADITLPDMECAACALQVIQYMQEHAPPPYYYQCADIVLTNATSGAGGSGAGGAGGSGATVAPTGSIDDAGCGCRVFSQRSPSGPVIVSAFALLLLSVRRRVARGT